MTVTLSISPKNTYFIDIVTPAIKSLTITDVTHNMNKLKYISWNLYDEDDNDIVVGNEVNGVLIGGNTSDVASKVGDIPAFHLDGATQYIQIAIPRILPSAVDKLWEKYAGNPVLTGPVNHRVLFGKLLNNPSGGWYCFLPRVEDNDIVRYESDNLIDWSNPLSCIQGGGDDSWDKTLGGGRVFIKPDGSWIMLYRGTNSAGNRKIGMATSIDGTTWIKKDNSGIDDGLFNNFGNNYDPVGIILVGTKYYCYFNGDPNHGTCNLYTCSDDFETFIADENNPMFQNQAGFFCPDIMYYQGNYYMLAARDLPNHSDTIYDHAIGLFRSSDPEFYTETTDFLGYVVVNDQTYDATYLDIPNFPTTNIYKNEVYLDDSDNLQMMYSSNSTYGQSLASTKLYKMTKRSQRLSQLYGVKMTISCLIQFDTLTDRDPIFSIGSSRSDGSAVTLCYVRSSESKFYVVLYLGEAKYTDFELQINTLYCLVIVENVSERKVYINGNLVGTFTEVSTNTDSTYLYIGSGGSSGRLLDGYVSDFRIYPKNLSDVEILNLYLTGHI